MPEFGKWQQITVKGNSEPRAILCQSKNLKEPVALLTKYNISRAWDSYHPLAIKAEMKIAEKFPVPQGIIPRGRHQALELRHQL